MLMKGWVTAEWSQTELNRKARFYKLTPPGKKQLGIEVEEFRRVTRAIENILQTRRDMLKARLMLLEWCLHDGSRPRANPLRCGAKTGESWR